MSGHIVVIGDVMTDVIVRPHGALVRGSDRAATIRTAPGGSGANQAAWLGHLGAKVVFAGRVGAADAAAQAESLRAHGVAPHLGVDPDLPTGLLVTLLDPDGERSFLSDRGANTRLCADDLPGSLLQGAALLHLSGYSLFCEAPRAAVLGFAAAARGRGIPVTLDAGSAGFLAEVGPARFLEWAAGVETLVANADEAEMLTGEREAAEQLAALAARFPVAIVKLGAAGAMAGAAGQTLSAPAPAVTAIDTTGAGDAFLAGYLAARLRGVGMAECLGEGVACGALAATRLGGRPCGVRGG